MLDITDDTFEKEVLKASELVLVDFWAPWCGPCKMLAPVLEAIAKENTGHLKVAKVNVDDCQNTSSQYGITSIPTMILFKDGKNVSSKVGALSKEALQKWIDSQK